MPTTSNFGWTTPADTDLVKDGAAAIRTLGNGVDASFIDLKGGTTGQILSKASNTDLDFTWTAGGDITEVQAGTGISVSSGTGPIPIVTNTVATAFDAAGDLVYGTGADTFTKLALGTANQVLTVNAGATAPEWKTPAGGGKVLQVVQATYATQTIITSTSYTDSGLSATITPSSATSKILILVNQNLLANRETTIFDGAVDLRRGNTSIYLQEFANGIAAATQGSPAYIQQRHYHNATYLDSPATTSATTYKTMGKLATAANSAQLVFQQNNAIGTMILLEIGA